MAAKKKIAAIVFLLTVVAVTWWAVLQTPRHKLEKLGFTKDEASEIVEKLGEPEVELVLARGYNSDILEYIRDENFDLAKFKYYLGVQLKGNFTPAEIIALVNHEDYNSKTTYDRKMFRILTDQYYLSKNQQRYFDYLEKLRQEASKNVEVPFEVEDEDAEVDSEPDIVPSKIVAIVNVGADKDFYQDAQAADTDKGELVLVNKYHYLSEDYQPELAELSVEYSQPGVVLAQAAYEPLVDMLAAAERDGYKLYVTSGYRGYSEQQEVLDSYLERMSEAEALEYAAKPGFSEHQTGLALDIFTIGGTIDNFANLPEAQWLAENAYKYGFILRYPKSKEDLTGYDYEAWHYRYVGKEVAEYIQDNDITFDEWWEWGSNR